jgi:fucose 4-O-acetylase-like acetyltransferase
MATWFLVGCITSSAIAWFGSVHPSFRVIPVALYILLFAVWVICWLVDDAVYPYLKLSQKDYYGLLIAVGVAIALGGLLQWLLG